MKTEATQTRWRLAQDYERRHWAKQAHRVKGGSHGIDWYSWNAGQVCRLLEPFLEAPPARVLEIGSGPVGTISCLPWGERYAVEPLEGYFSTQPELIRHRDPAVRYLEGSGERLPFEAGFFSLVICENVLDHTRSPAQVLAEARRVLAPGGLLFLGVNIHTGWGRLMRRVMEAFRIDKGHPHSYSRRTIRRLLEASGYAVLSEEWENPAAVWWRDLRSGSLKGLLKAGAGVSEMVYRSASRVSA